jgi:hypothetical protein
MLGKAVQDWKDGYLHELDFGFIRKYSPVWKGVGLEGMSTRTDN